VKAAIKKSDPDYFQRANKSSRQPYGMEIYAWHSNGGREPDVGSTKLNSVGIKGIRFLDGNSRADGQGSYNYVIFNDADIEITEENGQPVNLANSQGIVDSSFSIGRSNERLDGSATTNRINTNDPGGANIGDGTSPSSVVTPEMDTDYLRAAVSGDLDSVNELLNTVQKEKAESIRARFEASIQSVSGDYEQMGLRVIDGHVVEIG
jgi:hypothetical protein